MSKTAQKPSATKSKASIEHNAQPFVGRVPMESIRVAWEENPRMPKGMKPAAAYDALIGQGGKNISVLKASIEEHGILQTVLVEPYSDPKNPAIKWNLNGGFRRIACAQALRGKAAEKVKMIPVSTVQEGVSLEVGLTENSTDCRKDVNPIVNAERVAQAVAAGEAKKKDLASIARAIGYSPARVTKYLMLNSAPEHIKHLVRDLDWAESAVFVLKDINEEGDDDVAVTWDTKEVVNAVIQEIGKRGAPSASEVKEARARVLKALADEGAEEEGENEGEEAGSELDESEEALTPPEMSKKQAAEYQRKLGNLFIFAGEEAKMAMPPVEVLMIDKSSDPKMRLAFLAGAIYGINRARLGEVEDVLDKAVDERRRKHSAVKRLQRVIIDAAFWQHPVSKHDSINPEEFSKLADDFCYELSDSTKGDLKEKLGKLKAECDRVFAICEKRRKGAEGDDAKPLPAIKKGEAKKGKKVKPSKPAKKSAKK